MNLQVIFILRSATPEPVLVPRAKGPRTGACVEQKNGVGSLVLGIAVLMAAAGVSMALGAFVAGVLLASSEYRHALETDIEPFRGLLMGLFFIAVGMSIDFGLLATQPLLVLALVLGYQVVKGLLLRLIAGGVGVVEKSRWLFAVLLAQGGEFAFVVFGVARIGGVLPGAWDALLTLTVALSMALTPVLLIMEQRLMRPAGQPEREADAIEDEGAHVIIAGFGRFGQIVGRVLFASGVKATVLEHDRFRRQNVASLEAMLPHWHDEERRVQMARSARQQLEEQIERDRAELERSGGHGWQSELDKADRERA